MPVRDLRREWKELYAPPADRVVFVDVPGMNALMVDGEGDPNTSPAYQAAVEALYGLAYALEFALKRTGEDFVVMPLEGLGWSDDMATFSLQDRARWKWTLLIVQPPPVTSDHVRTACAEIARKKGLDLSGVRFEAFAEGEAAQIMHLGPYAAEAPTIERLHDAIREQGYRRRGKHHEIYLTDPRRTSPDRMRTFLRQPVEHAGGAGR
jgi:hypothetical protein